MALRFSANSVLAVCSSPGVGDSREFIIAIAAQAVAAEEIH
jgi:hypothetical protein